MPECAQDSRRHTDVVGHGRHTVASHRLASYSAKRQPRGVSREYREDPDRCCGIPRATRTGVRRIGAPVSDVADDAAVVALARAAVERAAPDELPHFPAASEAYLEGRDPAEAARQEATRSFGVAAVLLTPVALTLAKDVLGFLRVQLTEQAEKHGGEVIDRLVDRLLHRGEAKPATSEPVEPPELTDEQLAQVRAFALEKARLLNLSEAKAALLADSLVGSLATA